MKNHSPDTKRDTGPAVPRTFCGRELYTVDLAPIGQKPTCKTCTRLRPGW